MEQPSKVAKRWPAYLWFIAALAIVLACIALVFIVRLADKSFYGEGSRYHEARESERVNSGPSISIEQQGGTYKLRSESPQEHHESELFGLSADWWVAIATGFLGVFTALLWVVTFRLWKAAENTARTQLRAYVNTAQCGITLDGTIATVKFSYRNFGNTPAYRAASRAAIKIVDGRPNSFVQEMPAEPLIVMDIGPGGDIHEAGTCTVTAQEFSEIKAGTKSFAVTCIVNYTDAFEERRHSILRGLSSPDNGLVKDTRATWGWHIQSAEGCEST